MAEPESTHGDPQRFSYERPTEIGGAKMLSQLCNGSFVRGQIQIVTEEGATNRHSHAGSDGFWFVLAGQARFYAGLDDEESWTLDEHEGILVPHGCPYWFESVGDDELEILHVVGKSETIDDQRTDYEDRPDWFEDKDFEYFE